MRSLINKDKLFIVLLTIFNTLFVLYLLMIFYNNRLASDDFCSLVDLNKYGFFGAIKYIYTTWSGRFAAFSLIYFILLFNETINVVFTYNCLLYFGLIFSLYYLLASLSPTEKNKYSLSFSLFNLAALLINLFVLANYQFRTFLWLTCATYYFPLIAINLSTGILIRSAKSIFAFISLFICSFIIGGCSEIVGMLWIIFLISYPYLSNSVKFPGIKNYLYYLLMNRVFLFSILFSTLFFVIQFLSPGNSNRSGLFHSDSPINDSIFALGHSVYLLIIWMTPVKLFLYILTMLPIATIIIQQKIKIKQSAWWNMNWIYIVLLVFILYCIPMSVTIKQFGPERAYGPLAYITVMMFMMMLFYLKEKIKLISLYINYYAIISLLILIFIIADKMRIDWKEAKKYSYSYDMRMEQLEELRKLDVRGNIIVDSLYKNYVIPSAEIFNHDSGNYFVERCLCEAKKYPFTIELKE